jgi:phosphonate transport system substrate-binding protein
MSLGIRTSALLAALALALPLAASAAPESCSNRGDLDSMYCDRDGDLTADAPTDKSKFRNPSTIVFTYTPVEDPAVYAKIFQPFTDHLSKCIDKRVVFYQVQSNAAEIEAMRSGRLHVGGFSTGPTAFAVNLAGAVPFAVKGYADHFQGYQLWVIVKKDSPFRKLTDLKGKRVAHTSASSNSGNLAPRALFPKQGLVPDKDYKVLYSGKHDQSILGVNSGDYDAAPIASDVFERMARRGTIKESDFRVIFKSQTFPTSSFAYAHDLEPALRDRMLKCFYDYRFPPEMQSAFEGADRFFPVNFKDAWAVVREVDASAGEKKDRAAFERATAKEEAARKKKAAEAAKKK